jgi:hypothetical protein
VTLRRQTAAKKLFFVFTCRHGSTTHSPHERARSNTSAGTTNMRTSAAKCDRQRGVAPTMSTTVTSASPFYSEAAHRAIIALHCATSHRPFNFVNDKYYHKEVELLRPGTKIPAPSTVSLDIKHIYLELSKTVRMYFKVQVHLYCI